MTAALLERERPITGARPKSGRSAAARGTGTSRGRSPKTNTPKSTRPKLKVLDQQAIRQRARARQALLLMFIVVLLGFFGVAFVHAELVADQQELDSIRAEIAETEAEKAKLERAVEEASAPQIVVTRAMEDLGMVRAHQPVYIDATVPVRDLPATLTFSGRPDSTPAFAAPATATDIGLAAGVSGSATVGATDQLDQVAQGATVEQAPAESAQEAVQADPSQADPSPVEESSGETTTLSGLTVTVADADPSPRPTASVPAPSVPAQTSPNPAAPAGAPGLAGASAGAGEGSITVSPQGDTVTSIAGSRASTSGDGGESTSRLGGTSAGTGSG